MTLADNIEALTGPDRALDAEIAAAAGWQSYTDEEGARYWEPPTGWTDDSLWRPHAPNSWNLRRWACPRFTASLDVAMTLVPEGWAIDCLKEGEAGSWYVNSRPRDWVSSWHYAKAATPALALCAAALRAKEASNG